MTSSPLLKSLLAGLRRKRVREGNSGDCCGFEERGGWKRELREWEERGSRRKEAKEKGESFRVEERSRRISEEEVGGGQGGGSEEPKKKKRGGEGLCSFEKATSMVGTVARPLSVEQRCEWESIEPASYRQLADRSFFVLDAGQIDAARALRHDAIFLHTTSKRLEALEQASQLLFQGRSRSSLIPYPSTLLPRQISDLRFASSLIQPTTPILKRTSPLPSSTCPNNISSARSAESKTL